MVGPISRNAHRWVIQTCKAKGREIAKKLNEQIDKAREIVQQTPILKDISLRKELESTARDLAKISVEDKFKEHKYNLQKTVNNTSKNISKIFVHTKKFIRASYLSTTDMNWKARIFNDTSDK